MGTFKEPHGGELKNLYLSADEAEREKKNALEYKSWDLTEAGGLRRCPKRHAACLRRLVAHAHYTRCHGQLCLYVGYR